MFTNSICDICGKSASSLFLETDMWLCKHCYHNPEPSCRLFEYGHENPMDRKGSTAHIRDIKSRRLDTKTGTMYRETAPKTYFFPRG